MGHFFRQQSFSIGLLKLTKYIKTAEIIKYET